MKMSPFNSYEIISTHDAIRAFGEDTSLLIAKPRRSCCSTFWFTIPDGFYAIVTSHGVQVDYENIDGNRSCVWPSGLHLGPPWLQVSHLVTKQDILMTTTVTNCITKDNISVNVDVTIVFRIMGDAERGEDPQNIYKFVHHVTARGLEEELKAAQTEYIRTVVRKMDHSEMNIIQRMSPELGNTDSENSGRFDDQSTPMARLRHLEEEEEYVLSSHDESKEESENLEIVPTGEQDKLESNSVFKKSMKDSLNETLNSIGVEIVDVILNGVMLPDDIKTIMTQQTTNLSMEKAKQVHNQYNLLSLIQKEEVIQLEQTIEEEKVALLKDGELTKLVESIELMLEKSKVQEFIEKEKARTEVDVRLIHAESDYTVQKIIDTATLETRKITKETEAEAVVAMKDSESEVRKIEAIADMEGAYFDATGRKAIQRAEVITSPMMKNFNDHKSKMLKIKAQMALAENEMLVITGTSGGITANNMLMIDASLINSMEKRIPEHKRQRIFNELIRLSGAK